MAANKSIKKDLVGSLSPSIYGHELIKKGLLAQLFGALKKILESQAGAVQI